MMQHVLYTRCSQVCTETRRPESKSKPNHMTFHKKVTSTLAAAVWTAVTFLLSYGNVAFEIYWNMTTLWSNWERVRYYQQKNYTLKLQN